MSNTAKAGPQVGQVWQRKPPYRQRLRVRRVWTAGRGLILGEPELEGQTIVALQPLNGGREIISTVPELHERCALLTAADDLPLPAPDAAGTDER